MLLRLINRSGLRKMDIGSKKLTNPIKNWLVSSKNYKKTSKLFPNLNNYELPTDTLVRVDPVLHRHVPHHDVIPHLQRHPDVDHSGRQEVRRGHGSGWPSYA